MTDCHQIHDQIICCNKYYVDLNVL